MPKRPDTIETVVLAIELLRRIPRGRKITASELHEQLKHAGVERDLRTIQRQLEMLSSHFDIERDDRTKPYGYRWLEKSRGLMLTSLTPQESLLLTLAEDYLGNILPTGVRKSMSSFFVQARRNLTDAGNDQIEREWRQKVRVVATSQPLLPPRLEPGILEHVSESLYHNRWLRLKYRNARGKESGAEVMPLGLAQQGPNLYLVCRYRGYENERSLALHRMLAAEATTIQFERPKDFDLKKYDDEGRFGFGEGSRVELSFRIKKEFGFFLLETPLSNDQKVVSEEEWYVIHATLVETAVLKWWLRGFGDAVSDVCITPLAQNESSKK